MRSDKLLVEKGEPLLDFEIRKLMSQVESVRLDTGDLMWYGVEGDEDHMAERKRADDLIHSFTDGRLYDQFERMGRRAHKWLFIEGTIRTAGKGLVAEWVDSSGRKRGSEHAIPLATIESALLKLDYWAGVHVWWVRDTAHLAETVVRIWKQRLSPPVPRLWRPGVELMRRNPVAAAYSTYASIGVETAQALQHVFVTESALRQSSDAEILAVPGIGKQRLAAIRSRVGA